MNGIINQKWAKIYLLQLYQVSKITKEIQIYYNDNAIILIVIAAGIDLDFWWGKNGWQELLGKSVKTQKTRPQSKSFSFTGSCAGPQIFIFNRFLSDANATVLGITLWKSLKNSLTSEL